MMVGSVEKKIGILGTKLKWIIIRGGNKGIKGTGTGASSSGTSSTTRMTVEWPGGAGGETNSTKGPFPEAGEVAIWA